MKIIKIGTHPAYNQVL